MIDVPQQLPAPPRFFAGRLRELTELSNAVCDEVDSHANSIVSISGMGGIGKTWLVLHWANENKRRFPDGQLYVNLRGFDPSGAPLASSAALHGFLEALGLAADSIPVEPTAKAALYRGLVGGRRMLIVLDNASDSTQIEPLLPGGTTCAVLVTSRHQLSGLVTAHGAQPLTLHELEGDDAWELLTGRLGRDRIELEPDAVEDLLDHCAGLPLALGIMAARAAIHSEFRLSVIAAELSRESDRLDKFDGGELSTNLRAVLSWSYRALGPEEANTFGLLGIAPGPDIGVAACISLTALPSARVAAALRGLENAHLVLQHAPGRYRMHDLVRLYAVESGVSGKQGEIEALHRLFGYYLHGSFAAERRLYPDRRVIDIGEPPEGFVTPTLADETAILDWFRSEHPCLLAAQATATNRGWHTTVWQLAWTLHGYLWRRGHLHDQITTWRAGLTAADTLDDLPVRALAHRLLGQALARANLHGEAKSQLRQAIILAKKAGDIHGEARAYYDLAGAWQAIDAQQALRHTSHALKLFRLLANPVWEAEALNAVGWNHARLGHYRAAANSCKRALTLFARMGNRQGQATTLDCLGYVAHNTGNHAGALTHYRDSLALCRDLGATYNEADTLDHLGQAHASLHQYPQARAAWLQAIALNRAQQRMADVSRIEGQLADLPVPAVRPHRELNRSRSTGGHPIASSVDICGDRGPRIFVSYAHDSPEHKLSVLRFAELLVRNGMTVELDQWAATKRQDWGAWAISHITQADFVLIVGSPAYKNVGDGTLVTDQNRGVQSETALIRDLLHQDRASWIQKMLPVLLPGHDIEQIPCFLQPYTVDRYYVNEISDEGIEELLRVLTAQPSRVRPEPGRIPILPPFPPALPTQ